MTCIIDAEGNIKVTLGEHDHSSPEASGQNLRQIQEFNVDDATILTIDAVGTITRTQVYHIVAANAGAADNLDQIDGGLEGDELIIQADTGDTITVRHNAGGAGDNIWFAGGADIVLDNADHLRLVFNGTWWCDQSGGAGGLGDHTHSAPGDGGSTLAAHTVTGNVEFDDGAGDSPQLQFVGGSNDDTALIFVDDEAVAGQSDAVIRIPGAVAASTLRIDNSTPAAIASFDGAGGFRLWDGLLLGVRDGAGPAGQLSVGDASTNTALDVLQLERAITPPSVPVAGFGGRLRFKLNDDAGGPLEDAAAIDARWSDPGDGQVDSYLGFYVRVNDAALAEIVRVDGNGLLFALDKIIDMDELAAAPANPAANRWKIYPKAEGFYQLDDAGTETQLFGGGAAINLLTNGGHEIWQRGAGAFTAHGGYAADRWRLWEVGGDTLSVTRDGANKLTNSQYASAIVFTLVGGAGATQYRQELKVSDNHHGLLGETISFRASVKLAAGVASACRAFITTDGTGGATNYSAYHGNNTNWEELSVDGVAVPSDATYIYVGIAFTASCTAYVDNCMLVAAAAATDYVALIPTEEWDRCLRYYEIHGFIAGNSEWWASYGVGSTTSGWTKDFATRKAIVPTVTKLGTWFVVNCGQPVAAFPNFNGYTLYAMITALGRVSFYANSSDDGVTAEANP